VVALLAACAIAHKPAPERVPGVLAVGVGVYPDRGTDFDGRVQRGVCAPDVRDKETTRRRHCPREHRLFVFGTKDKQTQPCGSVPGLARRSCGVSRRIKTDLVESFFLLVEQHNLASQRRWERARKTMQAG
jgi:hypothetical protein